MNRFFSLPIVIGIAAGVVFPYQSLNLIWASSIFLVFILVINVLEAGSSLTAAFDKDSRTGFAIALTTLFVLLPAIQTAFASALLRDRDYVFGIAMASMAPPALVIPLFLRLNRGHVEVGVAFVILATLLCPVILIPMIRLMGISESFMDTTALFYYLLPTTALPVASALLIRRLFPTAVRKLLTRAGPLNSFALGALMFILVGSAFHHLPIRTWRSPDLITIFAMMVWMDFGVYFLMRWLWNDTAAIMLATRNFAVPANLLLFFDPKAALPSAVGLIVHAVFFQWLISKSARRSAEVSRA